MTAVQMKRLNVLRNTYSGVIGEMAIATALIRRGYKVAKPYWNDDVIDLLVLLPHESGHSFVPIPIQIKSLQPASEKECGDGLKKKYVDRTPLLCLAIYSPEHDRIWFIPGAHNIRKAHRAGVIRSQQRRGPNRVPWEKLEPTDAVRVYVDMSGTQSSELQEWLLNSDAQWKRLDRSLFGMTSRLASKTRSADILLNLAGDEEGAVSSAEEPRSGSNA
jgi:hypothetical protein